MRVHQGTDHLAVDHPEREGRHAGVLQEMQQVADPDVQNFPASQGQRLTDGGCDLAGLGKDLLQVRGDIAVAEYLLAAHDKPVFIGGCCLQIGGRGFREIGMQGGNGGDTALSAGSAFAAQRFRHAGKHLRVIGENKVKVGLQGNQFHAGTGIAGEAAEGRQAEIKGMIISGRAAAKDDRVYRPVDFQPHSLPCSHGFLPGLKASFHKAEDKIMPLEGQGAFQPGGQLLVPGGEPADAGGDLLELIAGCFICFPRKHTGDRPDGLGMTPGHPESKQKAQEDKYRQDGQDAEELLHDGGVDIGVAEDRSIGQPPVSAGESDLGPVLVFPSEQAGRSVLGGFHPVPGKGKLLRGGQQVIPLVDIGVDTVVNGVGKKRLVDAVLDQEQQDALSGSGSRPQRHQEGDNPGTVHKGGGNLLGGENGHPVSARNPGDKIFHRDKLIAHHARKKGKGHGG